MGMLIYDALVLTRIASTARAKKNVLTLGVPTLNFSCSNYRSAAKKIGIDVKGDNFREYRGFFEMLGYEQIVSLDISNYEGAEILGDLNDPTIASRINAQYDLVYDSGTIEHIFEITVALRTIRTLVRLGGVVVHASPANGFMDHGFWQISPDLFRSFYRSSGFDILTSALFTLGDAPVAFPADENIYRMRGRGFIAQNMSEALVIFAASKATTIENDNLTMQDYYSRMHAAKTTIHHSEFFIPYGSAQRAQLLRYPFAKRAFSAVRYISNKFR
ncbi:MAG TPA: hypothetical protein VNW15_04855 [Rhizomicrobium sp.]|jgi:hypothetical protein|nr:hypothetical protein [Rhizomicrobium sp.]